MSAEIKISLNKLIKLEGLGFAIVMLLVYLTVFQPRIGKIRMLNQRIKEVKAQPVETFSPESVEKYNQLKKRVEWLKRDIASMKEKMNFFNAGLPKELNIPSLLEEINRMAESNSLELVSITPEPEKTTGDYKKLLVGVKLQGRYHTFLNYLSQIIGPERSTYINKVSLGTGKAVYPNLDIELVIVIFSKSQT